MQTLVLFFVDNLYRGSNFEPYKISGLKIFNYVYEITLVTHTSKMFEN